jgi:Plasmid pRiA4b ORF-3-like protein
LEEGFALPRGTLFSFQVSATPAIRDLDLYAAVPDATRTRIVNVPDGADTVYQLRVVLAGISPLVWRRLLVPAEISAAGLHEILRAAFGWSDEHLHRFTIHAVEYGLSQPGSAGFSRDAR